MHLALKDVCSPDDSGWTNDRFKKLLEVEP